MITLKLIQLGGLASKVKFVKPCAAVFSKTYSTDPAQNVTFGELRTRQAEEFLQNLDDDMKKRKLEITMLLEEAAGAGTMMPTLTAPHWQCLLTECRSPAAVIRYCRYLYLTEQAKNNRRLKKQQRLQEKTEELTTPKRLFTMDPVQKRQLRQYEGLGKLQHGQHLVIDLDYNCSDREERSSKSQLLMAYKNNISHPAGFHLHFTSVNKHRQFHLEYQNGLLDTLLCDFYEKPFWELFPLKRLVYLTPDGPMLRDLDKNAIYVIGGLVDLHSENVRKSIAKAKQLGIRAGSFPVAQHGQYTKSTHSIPLTTVMDIMLGMQLHHDWKKVFAESFSEYRFCQNEEGSKKDRKKAKGKPFKRAVFQDGWHRDRIW